MVNRPIVNKGIEYITSVDLKVLSTNGTKIQIVTTPNVRDSSNTNSIDESLYQNGIVDLNLIGLGGADVSGFNALANPKFYYLYLVGDSTGYKQAGGIASQNNSKPILPSGYDMYRLIGYVLAQDNDTIAQYFINGSPYNLFYVIGLGVNQILFFSLIPAPTTFTLLDASQGVPTKDCLVNMLVSYVPNTPGNLIEFRVPGSSAANGIVRSSQSGEYPLQVPARVIDGVVYVDFKSSESTDAITLYPLTFTVY